MGAQWHTWILGEAVFLKRFLSSTSFYKWVGVYLLLNSHGKHSAVYQVCLIISHFKKVCWYILLNMKNKKNLAPTILFLLLFKKIYIFFKRLAIPLLLVWIKKSWTQLTLVKAFSSVNQTRKLACMHKKRIPKYLWYEHITQKLL